MKYKKKQSYINNTAARHYTTLPTSTFQLLLIAIQSYTFNRIRLLLMTASVDGDAADASLHFSPLLFAARTFSDLLI